MPNFITIWLIGIGVIAVLVILHGLIRDFFDGKKLETPHTAIIVDTHRDAMFGNTGGTYMLNLNRSYNVTFLIRSSGEQRKFVVPESDYTRAVEGHFVILTLQGSRYIGFEPMTWEEFENNDKTNKGENK